MYRIMVTGAKGQLGSEIRALSIAYSHQFYFVDIDELDITDKEAVEQFVGSNNIDFIINCAAYTAVDKAESEPDLADLINHKAVGYLAEAARRHKAKLVHISTDYVFDGESYRPYTPNDHCSPNSVYGKSKRLGEEEVLKTCFKDTLIIRTAWVYSSFGNNFVKTILRLAKERKSLNVVSDQIGSPTYARDLAMFIIECVDKMNWDVPRIFHYTNEGICSWFDFAKMICEIKQIDCIIKPIPTSQYPTPAQRPFYSVLSKEETKTHVQIEIPHWLDSLKNCLKIID